MLLSDGFKPLVPHWTARQAYIAFGSLLTSAALLRVDAGPMEGFVSPEFDKVLGLPAEELMTAMVCCAVGHRSTEDKYAGTPRVRLSKSEFLKRL
jgi:nitroreductase